MNVTDWPPYVCLNNPVIRINCTFTQWNQFAIQKRWPKISNRITEMLWIILWTRKFRWLFAKCSEWCKQPWPGFIMNFQSWARMSNVLTIQFFTRFSVRIKNTLMGAWFFHKLFGLHALCINHKYENKKKNSMKRLC